MLENLEDCLTRSVLSEVTLLSGERTGAPCQSQSAAVSTFSNRILGSYNRSVCFSPAGHLWSDVCHTMTVPQLSRQPGNSSAMSADVGGI